MRSWWLALKSSEMYNVKRTYKSRCLNEAIPTFLAYAYMILWSNIECRVYMSIGIVMYHLTCTYPNSRYSLLETSNSLSQCSFNIIHMLTVTTWSKQSKHLEFGGFLSMESTNVQPRHTRDCLSSISTQESTMFFTSALMMTEDDLAPFGWCVFFLLRTIMLPDFTRWKTLHVLWMFCLIVNVVWLQNDMVGYIYFQLSCCRPLGSLYHTGTRA